MNNRSRPATTLTFSFNGASSDSVSWSSFCAGSVRSIASDRPDETAGSTDSLPRIVVVLSMPMSAIRSGDVAGVSGVLAPESEASLPEFAHLVQ